MNKLAIIGSLGRDPELRSTPNGIPVCTFSVGVTRRKSNETEPQTDWFKVTAWRQLGENCARYLTKGKKVFVSGPVSVTTYTAKDGTTRASLEVTAEDVEFLSPAGGTADHEAAGAQADAKAGFVKVDDEELPF
jgi:single-strand DNA-binding protein